MTKVRLQRYKICIQYEQFKRAKKRKDDHVNKITNNTDKV